MPICPPGSTGIPKTGIPATVIANAGYAEAIVQFSGLEKLSPYIAIIGQLAYNTTTLCTDTDRTYPTLTADDFINAINWLDPVKYLASIGKLRQWVDTFAWYLNCTCTPSGLPTNNYTLPPTDLPQIVGTPATPCFQSTQFAFPLNPGNGLVANRLGDNLGGGPAAMWQVPITGVQAVMQHANTFPAGPSVLWELLIWNPNTSTIRSTTHVTTLPGQTKTAFVPTVPGDVFATLSEQVASGTGANMLTSQLFGFCNNGQPGLNQPQCCPPDPSLMGLINQVLAQVTLIQRYKVPFAYVRGATHSGLSGSGTITVPSGLIGLEMELTTIPGRVGQESASPDFVFDTGWWSVETVDAVVDERRLRHASQLWFPPFMSSVTKVGYSLTPGVVASLTELQAET